MLALSDASLVKVFTGEEIANVPDVKGQLRLVADPGEAGVLGRDGLTTPAWSAG